MEKARGHAAHLTLISSLLPWEWRKFYIYATSPEELLFLAKQDSFLATKFCVYTAEGKLRFSIQPTSLAETTCEIIDHFGKQIGVFSRKNKFATQWIIQDKNTNETGCVGISQSSVFSPKYEICFNHKVGGFFDIHYRVVQVKISLEHSSEISDNRKSLFLSAMLLIVGQRGNGLDAATG